MRDQTVKLGVNIDHVATLRQARGTTYPDVLDAARVCASAGAHGLTVHLREDRRHIQDRDVYALVEAAILPVNLEMAATADMVEVALDVKPGEICMVPERRHELTTEGGLDVVGGMRRIGDAVDRLQGAGIPASLFIEAREAQIEAALEVGVSCVELHTGAYCEAGSDRAEEELDELIRGADMAHAAGLRVNAGHGIHIDNVAGVLRIPHLDTLNIGHSIVARSVFMGLAEAVREMLKALVSDRIGVVGEPRLFTP